MHLDVCLNAQMEMATAQCTNAHKESFIENSIE